MKNRRRNRKVFAEHSYWQSYSDMMAALFADIYFVNSDYSCYIQTENE